MNINELFGKIKNNFSSDDLKGEFNLQGNCIVWTYNLNDGDEFEELDKSENDDDEQPEFESTSSEELLQDAYDDDVVMLEEYLDELEENDKWSFSEPEIAEKTISFKIF
jgi:hypothetical protein